MPSNIRLSSSTVVSVSVQCLPIASSKLRFSSLLTASMRYSNNWLRPSPPPPPPLSFFFEGNQRQAISTKRGLKLSFPLVLACAGTGHGSEILLGAGAPVSQRFLPADGREKEHAQHGQYGCFFSSLCLADGEPYPNRSSIRWPNCSTIGQTEQCGKASPTSYGLSFIAQCSAAPIIFVHHSHLYSLKEV